MFADFLMQQLLKQCAKHARTTTLGCKETMMLDSVGQGGLMCACVCGGGAPGWGEYDSVTLQHAA